ncbi:MAG: hypothetical protein ACRD24_14970 [Terriglobales bacterium]
MGGNGTIGGGKSLKVDITISDRHGNPKSSWVLDDSETGPGTGPNPTYPFDLVFVFPANAQTNGNTVTVPIKSKTDQVKVRWK